MTRAGCERVSNVDAGMQPLKQENAYSALLFAFCKGVLESLHDRGLRDMEFVLIEKEKRKLYKEAVSQ